MKRLIAAAGLIMVLLSAFEVQAGDPDAILGKWCDEERKIEFEIYKYDGKFIGKILWLREPYYPADDPKGMGGKPRVDRENPETAKRNRPLLGIDVVWNLVYAGENTWTDGLIYDPRNGSIYHCKVTIEGNDMMSVRNFIGVSLLGITKTLTRLNKPQDFAENQRNDASKTRMR